MPTIRDVANYANVSPATVSRVINCSDNISDETRAKVIEAIESLGYNFQTTGAVSAKRRSLLMIAHSLRNHAVSYIVEGVESAASYYDYKLLIHQMAGNLSLKDIENLAETCDAGGIVLFTDTIDTSVMKWISKKIPTSCIMPGCEVPGASTIKLDERDLMEKAVQHLIDQGKRKIALISGQTGCRHSVEIQQNYERVMMQRGLEIDPLWKVYIDTNFFSTTAAVMTENLLRSANPPDAFIGTTDVYAAGAIFACKKLGFSVPGDVAVIARDNTSICHVFDPTMTSFDMPAAQIGHTACSSLIEHIRSTDYTPKNVIISADLIIRGSTI